jgi:hypothetical protein
MKDYGMDEAEKIRKELAKLAEKHSKHQIALEEIRVREGEMCDELFKLTGNQCYADASAWLRMANGLQKAAHAQDDMAGCLALDMPVPETRSR